LASRTKQLKDRIKNRFKSIKRKSLIEIIKQGPVASYKRRVQKEKDALAKEGKGFRDIAFILTLASMTLALSFVPFFPQPLPILVAVLIAFIVYMNPAVGMSIGSIPIVLGILYQLSTIDFIGMLGPTIVRVLFICILIFFFVALPIRFRRYEDAIGINLGIIAAMLLFFDVTYFMAIPLLLTVAILFKRTQSGLAFSYYVMISVPLMIMQYFQHILTITRVDFWNETSAVPSIYTSLSTVFIHMQNGMFQFRMFDVSQTLGKIPWNVVESSPNPIHTVGQAINQYLDSVPGIVLFIVIVAGLVWVVSLVLPSLVNRSGTKQAETLFPALTAAGVTALFFLFMAILQDQLAFSSQIDSTMMLLGVLSSAIFAIPATMLNFAPKKKDEIEKNSQIILVKAGDLMVKLKAFESLMGKVKGSVPVNVSSPETKMTIIKEKLTDILAKAEAKNFKIPETYETIKELDKDLADGINSLPPELNTILEHYQLNLNYSYTNWIRKLQEIGYEIKNPVKIEFQKDQSPEVRVEYISAVLAASKTLANEVCQRAERVYDVLKSMYDLSLLAESRTISYSKQKLAEKTAPWIACDALVIAFKNWTKQYKPEISKSIASLQESLGSIASLDTRNKTLQATLGEKYPSVVNETKKAAEVRALLEAKEISVLNVFVLQDSLQSALYIAGNVLSTLFEELKAKEESIENLVPVEDNFWEKNVTLREQLESAIEKISDSKKYKPRDMLKNLPEALSFIEPCLWTIAQYNVKNELLLNYPIAKTAIEDQLRKKKRVSVQDLPFEAKDAEEYLKMFFNERSNEFIFDEQSLQLARKA
jgi:hypothetical protein